MSVIKGNKESKTILDFSDVSLTKSYIKQSLRDVEVRHHTVQEGRQDVYTFYDNYIKVGMYNLQLVLVSNLHEAKTSLKEYDHFFVKIFENDKEINAKRDNRFSYKPTFGGPMTGPCLIDLIHHCKRLDEMRAFL